MVFDEAKSQEEVYKFCKEPILQVPAGYNCTIFCYGQTGSGKTYTMFGPNWSSETSSFVGRKRHFRMHSDGFAKSMESYKGIIPRAITDLFKQANEVYHTEGIEYSIYCSFIQIYNEKLFDLLQDKDNTRSLNIREDKHDGIFVEGLTEYQVKTIQDCYTLLKRGERNRVTRQTKANIKSSRSHTIFQLLLESNRMDVNGKLRKSKLNLCDLAGSEKIQTEEKLGEQHMEEHKSINLSLSTLGKVVASLAKNGSHKNVPYRESKLTRILRDCFGGNQSLKKGQVSALSSSIILIATLSPMLYHIDETISTLKFADSSKRVLVKKSLNEINGKEDAVVQKLRREVQYLKDILQFNRSGYKGNTAESYHKMIYLDKIAPLEKELLSLKEQNYKLREIAQKADYVKKLEAENNQLRQEIQQFRNTQKTDGFIAWQHQEKDKLDERSDAMNHTEFDNGDVKKNIFITEQDPHQENQDIDLDEIYKLPIENEAIEEGPSYELKSSFSNKPSLNKQSSLGKKPSGVHVMSPFVMTPLHNQKNLPVNINIRSASIGTVEEKLPEERSQVKVSQLPQAFNSWSLKGKLVNDGRCPKCTLKIPCAHYKTQEEVHSDPSNFPKKQNSLFSVINKVSERKDMISRETTKDYSSVQKYIESDRSKDVKFFSKRQLDISTNHEELDPALQNQSDEENKSIFTQNILNTSDDPLQKMIKRKMRGEKQSENGIYALKSPLSNLVEYNSQQITPATVTDYRRTSYGQRLSKDDDNNPVRMRIRGKSNNIEFREGNLNQTMYEQHRRINLKRQRQEDRSKLKKLQKIERYREERLLQEISALEEEKRILSQEHKKEVIKERK
ncbi:unnamed protein product [Moneuplotes crassus]|uniref:Kinesin-like protein n=1 Tax=Euplotes crassus TaxID=5936 RepID=A0AAD2D267_EUPCR|nr:unnamed protein product [Moneuplotes crassus]